MSAQPLRALQSDTATGATPPSLAIVARSGRTERTPASSPVTLSLIRSPQHSLRARVRTAAGVSYVCDPVNHCIDVVAADGRPMFSFGGYGSCNGQFHTPAGVAIVQLASSEEDVESAEPELLAVADRGNHRIQIFELDGAFVGVIGGASVRPSIAGWAPRAAWPLFRMGSVPNLRFPSALHWDDAFLTITCGDGSTVRVDLAAALLPDFETWLSEAPLPEIQRAALRFCSGTDQHHIPGAHLRRIIEALQPELDDLDESAGPTLG